MALANGGGVAGGDRPVIELIFLPEILKDRIRFVNKIFTANFRIKFPVKKGLFIIIALLPGLLSFAQQKHTISGTIKDQQTGEALIGASVILSGSPSSGAVSNSYGFYSLSAPASNYILIASFSGYANDTLKISLTKDVMQSIELSPEGTQLQEVVVARRKNDNITHTLPGVQKVSIEEIK